MDGDSVDFTRSYVCEKSGRRIRPKGWRPHRGCPHEGCNIILQGGSRFKWSESNTRYEYIGERGTRTRILFRTY